MRNKHNNVIIKGCGNNRTMETESFPTETAFFYISFAAVIFASVPLLGYIVPPGERVDLQWWQTGIIYEVNLGDCLKVSGVNQELCTIKGLTSKLDNISSLGVTTIRLVSDPNVELSDHLSVHTDHGTLSDFGEFVTVLHKKGLKLIIDLHLSHTSINNHWFHKSLQGVEHFKDFYIWHGGISHETGVIDPPNNWGAHPGNESAWTWDTRSKEFYLQGYSKHFTNLNYTNPHVKEEIKKVLLFWLDHGVDGFVVNGIDNIWDINAEHIHELYHDEEFHDTSFLRQKQISLVNNVTAEWREILTDYSTNTGTYVCLFVDTYNDRQTLPHSNKFYTTGVDMILNKFLQERIQKKCNGVCLKNSVGQIMMSLPENTWTNWLIRYDNEEVSKAFTIYMMLNLLLPGTHRISVYPQLLEKYFLYKESESNWKELLQIREIPAFKWGTGQVAKSTHNTLSFIRYAHGTLYKRYLVVINMGNIAETIDFSGRYEKIKVGVVGTEVFTTKHQNTVDKHVDLHNLTIDAKQGIVILI